MFIAVFFFICFQEFVCDQSHDLYTPIISQVLMFFYQNDILDEDVIVKWYETSLQPGKFKTQVCLMTSFPGVNNLYK